MGKMFFEIGKGQENCITKLAAVHVCCLKNIEKIFQELLE